MAKPNQPQVAGYYPHGQMLYRQQPYYGMMPPQTPQPLQVPTPVTGTKGGIDVPGMLPIEQSYIENILRINKGKLVEVHATFENNKEWNAMIFRGLIEAAGRDHLIISDPETGKRYLIPMVYVDYVTFDEPIEYEYPFGAGAAR
ncbi:spore germination protein Q [Bacillus thermophilus]|uniref:Spore germination protein Q n=2 Tax=Siminovitchia thermophila TaxID=1245522 RepID=A0ABS2R474_9BACI|nr:spore germination protein Q [Siminovitchia thermophila]